MRFLSYLLPSIVLYFASCSKGKYYDITYVVDVTPEVDSLPISVKIGSQTFDQKHWSMVSSQRIDTYVTITAQGLSNVKRIDASISGWKNPPSVEHCESPNCSVEVRYNLYDK